MRLFTFLYKNRVKKKVEGCRSLVLMKFLVKLMKLRRFKPRDLDSW